MATRFRASDQAYLPGDAGPEQVPIVYHTNEDAVNGDFREGHLVTGVYPGEGSHGKKVNKKENEENKNVWLRPPGMKKVSWYTHSGKDSMF